MDSTSTVSQSEFDILEMAGLSMTGDNNVLNKVSPGAFRKEIAFFRPQSSVSNLDGGTVDIPLTRKNLLIGDFYLRVKRAAQVTGTDLYKPLYQCINRLRLQFNSKNIIDYDSEMILTDWLLENSGDVEMQLQEQIQQGFIATADSRWVTLKLPSFDRFIKGPLSAFQGEWVLSIDFKRNNEVTTTNTSGNTTGWILDVAVFQSGFRLPYKMIKRANEILSKGAIYKFLKPIHIRQKGTGTNPFQITFNMIRQRVTAIYFWIESGSGNLFNMKSIHRAADPTDTTTFSLGTVSNENLYTGREIPLKMLTLADQLNNGLVPVVTAENGNNDTSETGISWKYVQLPIYVWSFSDSDKMAYSTGISNGSVESVNDIVLTLKPSIPSTDTVHFLILTRAGIKFTSQTLNADVRAIELDSLKTESM